MQIVKQEAARIQRVRARRETSDTQMDLMKIYGIFCVVYAHCYTHGLRFFGRGLVSSVYVIQLFIFCSGYLYRTGTDRSPALPYLKKCARAYLLPFFLWNLIYGSVYNLLSLLGVARFGAPLSLYTLLIQPWINNEQFLLNLPAWFLLSLFLVAVVQWAVRRALDRVRPLGLRGNLGLLAVYFAGSVLAVRLGGGQERHGPETILIRLLVLLPYYQLGILYRTWRSRLPEWAGIPVILVGIAVLTAFGGGFETKMLYGQFVGNPLGIVAAALWAVLAVAEICRRLTPCCKGLVPVFLLGRSTLYIMLHHLSVIYCVQGMLFLWNRVSGLPGYDSDAFRDSIWYRYDFGHPARTAVLVPLGLLLPVGIHIIYERAVLHLARTD